MFTKRLLRDRQLSEEEVELKVDKDNFLISKTDPNIRFAKDKNESKLLTKAYCSNDGGETWFECYLERKSENHSDKGKMTQTGKYIFRTPKKGEGRWNGERVSTGRNVLTWYTNYPEPDRKQKEGYDIDHKYNDYENDNLDNLKCITHQENVQKAKNKMIKIPGYIGTWYEIERETLNDKTYLLLENEKYGNEIAHLFVEKEGSEFKVINDESFDMSIDELIRDFVVNDTIGDSKIKRLNNLTENDEDEDNEIVYKGITIYETPYGWEFNYKNYNYQTETDEEAYKAIDNLLDSRINDSQVDELIRDFDNIIHAVYESSGYLPPFTKTVELIEELSDNYDNVLYLDDVNWSIRDKKAIIESAINEASNFDNTDVYNSRARHRSPRDIVSDLKNIFGVDNKYIN